MSSGLGFDPSRNLSLLTVGPPLPSLSSSGGRREQGPFLVGRKKKKKLTEEDDQVPVAFATCWLPHAYAVALAGREYDNAYPRSLRDSVMKSSTLDKTTKQRIVRAESASRNGFESLGFFAAGVAAATAAGTSAPLLNALSGGYVASRAAYVVVYARLQDNRRAAPLRSLLWLVGAVLAGAIWVRAGLDLARPA
ncbi:hypothetical protein CDD83_7710 [Cordyceps sp. RAO-2017]|nr:hypothetical protein CDD83_7710 [Cordyceps sp. RAO-2017]